MAHTFEPCYRRHPCRALLSTLRRDLHAHPELSWKETVTQARLEGALADVGAADVRRLFAGHPDTDWVLVDDLADSGVTLKAVWTPGHTPGHLCIYDPNRKITFTGSTPVGSTPATFESRIHAQLKSWGEVIRKAGIKLQ